MTFWEIAFIGFLVFVIVLFIWGVSQFADDALLLLLWIPPIVVVVGAVLYFSGERELFTPVGTALYFLAVLLLIPLFIWLYHEIFDD